MKRPLIAAVWAVLAIPAVSMADEVPTSAPVTAPATTPPPITPPPIPSGLPGTVPGAPLTVQGMTREQHSAIVKQSREQLTTDLKPLIERNKALSVRWVRFPGPYALNRYYPKDALRKGIEAVVLAECDWNNEGVVTGCRVLEENPPALGFGDATRSLLMQTGQLGPKTGAPPLQAGQGLPVILRWALY